MFEESVISKAIIERYTERYIKALNSDVIIVGAGPSGLMAGWRMAEKGLSVVMFEKKLATGGGIMGGGMMMSEVVIQEEAKPYLDEIDCSLRKYNENLYTTDAIELTACLTMKCIKSGVNILNMHFAEDIVVHDGRVTGVVVNRSNITGIYHVDPLMFRSKAVLDGTGHDAIMVGHLKKRGLLDAVMKDGAMDAFEGEKFVVERTGEIFPGLFISGMSVCAAYGGPRMGPIFGGMILSGVKVAEQIINSVRKL